MVSRPGVGDSGLGWAGHVGGVECGCVGGGGRARGLAALGEQPASSTTASDPSRLTARSCPSLTCPSDPWPLQVQLESALSHCQECMSHLQKTQVSHLVQSFSPSFHE